MVNATLPATEQIWGWLHEVPDPEVPAISVVDLGIVRDVAWQEDGDEPECVVTITPTYSGCPAMGVIAQAISETLRQHGVNRVRLATQLSPAWTTDWMSESGKTKLKGYGIAPPVQQAIDISGISRRRNTAPIACPHCGSTHTRVVSEFGSTSCKALYRCDDCREPFDYFKPH
ncbi:phenylacetate-CoA oxygenase subunit PaaJ [Noviherbaspirillum cavernae]|uniref:Phenylacetate-CoA oxygenase subunit PaaJ n=1 Tax=Noviherbaspirillum cavernae TaxID=2320862 RepID=A0A418X520_9BURK|nr:1,2-phenylacetyl-CoA epoxidase subunit PaaD [Noviherbaspirillum cavernae]RJG07535.1 phenylacetate-CoA oxygenase subunit PaaJ [Noviherbaspirillum cavernae]